MAEGNPTALGPTQYLTRDDALQHGNYERHIPRLVFPPKGVTLTTILEAV